MTDLNSLRAFAPLSLSGARSIVHGATQLLTKAARANLAPVADDSHSNLGWDAANGRFECQPMDKDGAVYKVGLTVSSLVLSLHKDGDSVDQTDLAGLTVAKSEAWLDRALTDAGLAAASAVDLPYELPGDVTSVETFSMPAELQGVAAWFDFAHDILGAFATANFQLDPGPSPVRCWPHHFDIATYVGLEHGDAETARGIGVGMSPGDESHDQPYFYINPWPHLDPEGLPDLPAPGGWHTEGYVGAVATADQVLTLSDPRTEFPAFVDAAFAIGRQKLGV